MQAAIDTLTVALDQNIKRPLDSNLWKRILSPPALSPAALDILLKTVSQNALEFDEQSWFRLLHQMHVLSLRNLVCISLHVLNDSSPEGNHLITLCKPHYLSFDKDVSFRSKLGKIENGP